MYRLPDKAYSSMDFGGRGFITETDILKSLVTQRIGESKRNYTVEDIAEYFRQENIFSDNQGIGGISLD
jgi:hypothetical protein